MNRIAVMMILAFASAQSFAGKACEELKDEITQKLEAKGVKAFTLDVVDTADVGDKKVVGSCDGGTKKIVYTRK